MNKWDSYYHMILKVDGWCLLGAGPQHSPGVDSISTPQRRGWQSSGSCQSGWGQGYRARLQLQERGVNTGQDSKGEAGPRDAHGSGS